MSQYTRHHHKIDSFANIATAALLSRLCACVHNFLVLWEGPGVICRHAPSDFYLFLHLKYFLGCLRFHEDNEVKEAVNTWFASQAASFCDAGIQKLVPCYNKCLKNGGNYIEK
jgi:hypothetical protein